MGKRVRLEEKREQEQKSGQPPPGTAVKIAVDLSRSKWVYCVRWEGAERLRLSTSGQLKHLQARYGATRAARYTSRSKRADSATKWRGGRGRSRSRSR